MIKSRDEIIHKQEQEKERQKRKSSRPTDWKTNYVDGLDTLRTQGKGDKNKVEGWYTNEVKETLKKIFSKKKKDSGKKAWYISK